MTVGLVADWPTPKLEDLAACNTSLFGVAGREVGIGEALKLVQTGTVRDTKIFGVLKVAQNVDDRVPVRRRRVAAEASK